MEINSFHIASGKTIPSKTAPYSGNNFPTSASLLASAKLDESSQGTPRIADHRS